MFDGVKVRTSGKPVHYSKFYILQLLKTLAVYAERVLPFADLIGNNWFRIWFPNRQDPPNKRKILTNCDVSSKRKVLASCFNGEVSRCWYFLYSFQKFLHCFLSTSSSGFCPTGASFYLWLGHRVALDLPLHFFVLASRITFIFVSLIRTRCPILTVAVRRGLITVWYLTCA